MIQRKSQVTTRILHAIKQWQTLSKESNRNSKNYSDSVTLFLLEIGVRGHQLLANRRKLMFSHQPTRHQ